MRSKKKFERSVRRDTIRAVPDVPTKDEAPTESRQSELPASAKRLLAGATICFAERGYQASTTRDISNHADLSPGALYVHFESKEHLLYELIRNAHTELLSALQALPDPEPGSELQLVRDQIRTVTHWHVENYLLARVAQTELPNLSDEHRESVRGLRASIEAALRAPVTAGCETGVFRCADPRLFVRAMLSLSVDVIRWYDPHGRYTAADLAQSNADILTAYLLRPA
jgi:AcrR family transcriptional regulator